jgi:hypothetical protein
LLKRAGTISILPVLTAAIAGLASGLILTNHCVEINGSTTELQRWQRPIDSVWSCTWSSRPSFERSSTSFFRAS